MMILRISPRVTATAASANASSTKNAVCVKFIRSRASPIQYDVAAPTLRVDGRGGGNLQSSFGPARSSLRQRGRLAVWGHRKRGDANISREFGVERCHHA